MMEPAYGWAALITLRRTAAMLPIAGVRGVNAGNDAGMCRIELQQERRSSHRLT